MKRPNKILKYIRKRQNKNMAKVEIAVPIWIKQLPLDIFRYSLSLILFLGKIGVFGNPALEGLDWWIVFAPALFLEAATLVVTFAVVLTIGIWAILVWLYFGIKCLISDFKYKSWKNI